MNFLDFFRIINSFDLIEIGDFVAYADNKIRYQLLEK